jgi:predicted nucleotide-binding protein (sugar kinase/HSP70/actin superfamily)
MFPLFNRFFHALGYNVLLSDVSSDATVELGQANVKEEVCFPLKLAVGHIASLIAQGVDYLFMPSVHGKGICVYMQKAPQVLVACTELKEKGIPLLAPDICMDAPKSISKALTETARQLGHGRIASTLATFASGALLRARQVGFRSKSLPVMGEDEIGFVLVSRYYGLSDPVLSLNIKQKLNDLGYKVYDFPYQQTIFDHLRSNIYWPFGREVLTAAKKLRKNQNLYPIYLTYHGCGPDTMLTHWFDNEVSEKPYLAIEVDEHSGAVGVMTRLEAFVNSVSGRSNSQAVVRVSRVSALDEKGIRSTIREASRKRPLAIPNLYPYSGLLTAYLSCKGFNAIELQPTSVQSFAAGHELMRSKEYFTLTALMGDCMTYAGKSNAAQILLPQNIGAENNGLYARFVRSKLDEQGYRNISVIAPLWEHLIKEKSTSEAMFSVFLAGDILLCAKPASRDQLLLEMQRTFASGIPTDENFIVWARLAKGDKKTRFILCGGEPACFLNPLFRSELETRCEKAEYALRYTPLSELLLFEQAENGLPVKTKETLLLSISDTLNFGSPFASSLSRLSEAADSVLGSHAAANGQCTGCSVGCRGCKCRVLSAGGRFRAGKTSLLPTGYYGLIHAASMYENTSSVLSLMDDTLGAKQLELRFEGSVSAAEAARIATWLHFLT